MDMPVASRQKSGLRQLFAGGLLRSYDKNQIIYYEGDAVSRFYYIEDGYVKVYTILESGDMRTLFIFGPGDCLPLIFSRPDRWDLDSVYYFYQTMTKAKLWSVDSKTAGQQILADKNTMAAYLDYVSEMNLSMTKQLELLKSKKAIIKLEMLLPYLVSKVGRRVRPDVYRLDLKLSHQELADLSGVTRETMTLLLKLLKLKHVLKYQKGRWVVYVKNLSRLVNHPTA